MTRLFRLGQVVLTAGVNDKMEEGEFEPFFYLNRHVSGDWGDLSPDDKQMNDEAVQIGERILSAYNTPEIGKIWIITEWDRSVTTILFPSEY